jgi:hypothetical protein
MRLGEAVLRLLARVQKSELRRRYSDRNGLDYGRYSLRVRIEGSAIGALPVPERVIGREASLSRDFMMPWGVKRGDLLVLDPGESARVVSPRRARQTEGLPVPGRVRLESGDFDRDGYPEDVIANAFACARVQPHRGARLQSLRGRSGQDRFAQPFDYVMGGKYILLGGAEEGIAEAGKPGELWKSAFEREELSAGEDRVEIAYRRTLDNPRGVTLRKTVSAEPYLPGVMESYALTYAGRPETDEGIPVGSGKGGRKEGEDETDITFFLRFTTAVIGDCGSRNVFDVSSRTGIRTVRYHRPGFGRRWRWRDWRDEHFGPGGGFVVSRHEELGNVLAVLFHPRRASHVSVRCDYTGPEVSVVHLARKVKKGRRVDFGAAFLVGDGAACDGDSMLLVSLGTPAGGRVPLALTLRTGGRLQRASAAVSTRRGRRTVSLRRRDLPHAGAILAGVVHVPTDAFPVRISAAPRGERLSLTLEG